MTEYRFPESDETVQATLARVLDLKGMAPEAQLVRMAELTVEHTDSDSFRGRTDYHTIRLRLPLEVFVQIESAIKTHEKQLLAVSESIWRDFETDVISAVRLAPDRARIEAGATGAVALATIPAFWDDKRFRLFVSHCSSHKVEVAALKAALEQFGVCGFVAHDDIEPTLLWEAEIEKALRSCEALVAVVTDDFSESLWCDQEVGFCLGRGLPVIPVQLGKAPHGFIGKIQALPVPKGSTLAAQAQALVGLLLRTPQAAPSMTTALAYALDRAGSFAQAKTLAAMLENAPSVSPAQAAILRGAVKANGQVNASWGVPDRIARILNSHNV